VISWAEIVIISITVLILLVYHLHLAYRVRSSPLTTAIGTANQLRREWVQTVMEEKRDILAIQTLRNWVMAASFLASTSILISLGIIGAIFRSDKIAEIANALNLLGTKSETLWLIKMMLLIVDFLFAIFNFTLSIRYYNHAGFAINVPTVKDPIVTYDAVAATVNHGALHYTFGMRAFYFAVVFALWMFGPTWMLMGTIILIAVLYNLDRSM
jgi:uncharacterized membrane protein